MSEAEGHFICYPRTQGREGKASGLCLPAHLILGGGSLKSALLPYTSHPVRRASLALPPTNWTLTGTPPAAPSPHLSRR